MPGLLIEGTPVGGFLVLRCLGPREELEQLQGPWTPRYLDQGKEGSGATLVLDMEPAEAKVLDAVRRAGMLLLPPIVWKGGRLTLQILSFSGRSHGIEEILADARVESMTDLLPDQVGDQVRSSGLMLPTLTQKQGQALLAALQAGYYDAPRGATAGEVAASLGVARSSFEESLRSAESKIVRAVAPLARMRAMGTDQERARAGAEALHLYARFSEDLGMFINMALRNGEVTSVSMTGEEPSEPHGADHPYLARITEHLSTGKDDLKDIPVSISVTPFEREVLNALREIPLGEVLTYGEVARKLGRPRAARAVGGACARNPVPIIIPCHRVVPASGGLGNYSGGAGSRTKVAILAKEGALDRVSKRKRRG